VSKCYNQIKINESFSGPADMAFGKAFAETEMPGIPEESLKQFYEELTPNIYESQQEGVEAAGYTQEQKQDWRESRQSFIRQGAPEEVKQNAQDVIDGKMTEKEFIDRSRLIHQQQNKMPRLWTELPPSPTDKEIVFSLNIPQKGLIDTGPVDENDTTPNKIKKKRLPDGLPVASRLDINAYKQFDVWVVTVHKRNRPGGTPDSPLGYSKSAHLRDVKFEYGDGKFGEKNRKNAYGITTGKGKSVIAAFDGKWINTPTKTLINYADTLFNNPEWRQIAMNPDIMAGYFFDRETLQIVESASEVVQFGPLMFAKDVKYMDENKLIRYLK